MVSVLPRTILFLKIIVNQVHRTVFENENCFSFRMPSITRAIFCVSNELFQPTGKVPYGRL